MKRYLRTILLSLFACVLIFGFVSESFAAVTMRIYFRRYQVGGTEAVDNIPYATLMDAAYNVHFGIVGTDAKNLIFYLFDKTSSDSEDSPLYDTITPDDQAGNGRWKKATGLSLGRTAAQGNAYRSSDCTDSDINVYEYINCTITGSGAEECGKYTQVQTAGVLTTIARQFAPETESFTDDQDLSVIARMVLLSGDDDTNSDILDLQDGDFPDQEIHLVASAGIDTDDTVTIAMTDTTCTNCPVIVFDKIGENAKLTWTGTTWVVASVQSSL